MRRILIFLVLVGLAGCAPVNVATIRNTGELQSFQARGNYQANYRLLLDEMRRCMQSGMITASVIISGDLYPDVQKGTITATRHGAMGADVFMVVDVVNESSDATRVDVRTRSTSVKDAALLRGAVDGTPLCAK